jgi:hypothetical protein
MREQYLSFLGLPPQATAEEIKKRYRELVLRYHPDVNREPGAAEQFLKIQQAYEKVMGDDPELLKMVSGFKPPKSKKKPPGVARAEFVRQRMADYMKERERESREVEEHMFYRLTHGWIYMLAKALGTVGFGFGVLMMIDFAMAPVYETGIVETKAYYEHFQRNTIFLVDANPVDVPELVYIKITRGDTFSLQYSPITHEFEAWVIQKTNGTPPVVIESEFNFFTLFPLFPLLFLISGFIWFYKRNTTGFYMLYLVVLVPLPALILHYGLKEGKFKYLFEFLAG